MKKIVLASASPRRKKLLQQINFRFQVLPSSVDESFNSKTDPTKVVQQLALRKMRDVAQRIVKALIIAADTIVVFENRILGKPVDDNNARTMLHTLSGKTHHVCTGVALAKVEQHTIIDSLTFFEKTKVTFGTLNPKDIDHYVAGGSPMDKAGGYGIQDDYGAVFVRRIEGDFYNVVGFPLHAFYYKMNSFAPEYLPANSN